MSGREVTRLSVGRHTRRLDGRTETHEFVVQVPSDLRWFQGHFDGNPVLPAVVQLREVTRMISSIWPGIGLLRGIVRAKFRRPIRPADQLLVRLRRQEGSDKVSFEYLRNGDPCSSGVLDVSPDNATPD